MHGGDNKFEYRRAAASRQGARSVLAALAAVACLGTLSACESFRNLDPQWKFWEPSDRTQDGDGKAASLDGKRVVDPAAVRRVQTMLTKLGYRPGPADGVYGRRTVKAVRKYQSDHQLQVDGLVSLPLLRHLEATLSDRPARQSAKPQVQNRDKVPPKTAAKITPLSTTALLPLKKSDLPSYKVGASFIYSGGRVDRVTGIRGETVRWQRNNGTAYTAYRNFLVPWSSWISRIDRGTVSLSQKADTIWPLNKGDVSEYTATVMVQMKARPRPPVKKIESWKCRNVGQVRVKILAGSFDTVKFECDREGGASIQQMKRTWYYAPSIRHHVRVEDETVGPNRTRLQYDLLAIQPTAASWPPIARAALERAVLKALRTTPDGKTVPWTSSGVRTNVEIEMGSRFGRADGSECRPFVQVWSEGDKKARYPAVACRGVSDEWRIPGLGAKTSRSLAISGVS